MTMHQEHQALLPPAVADWATGVRLTKIHEEDNSSFINRPVRSTYPKKKTVSTSGATAPIAITMEEIAFYWEIRPSSMKRRLAVLRSCCACEHSAC
jgi:hypothetical protein